MLMLIPIPLVVGRDRYGVFPLKGKLLNVREASHKQIMANSEVRSTCVQREHVDAMACHHAHFARRSCTLMFDCLR